MTSDHLGAWGKGAGVVEVLDMSPCRILVVEDHDATLQLVRELLETEGDRFVVEAHDAKEAYRQYLTFRPDVIVTDLSLPGEDGLDIAAQILEFDEAVKVVVYSGHLDEAVFGRAEALGVAACVEKPNVDALLARVGEQCGDLRPI